MSFIESGQTTDCSVATWITSPEYRSDHLKIDLATFEEVTDLLLKRPNLNSTHLFRADILYDSSGKFQTIIQIERGNNPKKVITISKDGRDLNNTEIGPETVEAPVFDGYQLQRTVLRRLIPRKPQLDDYLKQSCFIYDTKASSLATDHKQLVVYVPHVESEDSMPWYHPRVQALAYLYEPHETGPTISVHYKQFTPAINTELEQRLHRIFQSLLHTIVRLTKIDAPKKNVVSSSSGPISMRSTAPSAIRDTILAQHLVQDTYTQLKQRYARDLIDRWVEKTEPSKHVFEDLSIAAFLIELWKQMYDLNHDQHSFPGFVDLACGNGVLVYVLIKEGYRGYGYDARRRKTWQVLGIDDYLEERICIPQPLLDVLDEHGDGTSRVGLDGLNIHDGIFPPGTFIISNHADELTPWTPILAALSTPSSPNPFLAIPCCSHGLSGVRYRYTLNDVDVAYVQSQSGDAQIADVDLNADDDPPEQEEDSKGDLRVLRARKMATANHTSESSQYACLTKKVVALTEEIGSEVEMTMMRIPSTRNIGIVGNRKLNANGGDYGDSQVGDYKGRDDRGETIHEMLLRECSKDGGLKAAADIWVDRAKKLQTGSGRGKIKSGVKAEIVKANSCAD